MEGKKSFFPSIFLFLTKYPASDWLNPRLIVYNQLALAKLGRRLFYMRSEIGNVAHSAVLAIIISYPTGPSGIIVLLKTPTKYREFFLTLFVKTTDFQFVLNFEQTRTITIFEEHGIMMD